MTTFLFLFRELLGAVRARSAGFLLLTCLLVAVFLGSFASLFLFVSPEAQDPADLSPSEVRLWLSPRLTTSAIDALYYGLQVRDDVSEIRYQFEQQAGGTGARGLFIVTVPGTADVAGFAAAAMRMDGVDEVETLAEEDTVRPLSLAASIRIGLLLGLTLSAALSLIAGRMGFRRLLEDFANAIRLLRLSGIPQRAISPPVVALGAMLGMLAGLLIAAGIALLHLTVSPTSAFAAVGLVEVGRVAGILVVDFLLGATMGSLIGLLGASFLGRPVFSPLP